MNAWKTSEARVLKKSRGEISTEDRETIDLYLANHSPTVQLIGTWAERIITWRFWVLRHERKDILQEVHKRLVIRLRDDGVKDSLKGYVESIAFYCCADITRRYHPTTSIDDPPGLIEIVDSRQDSSRRVEKREAREAAEEIYDKLAPACREILALLFFDGLKYEEIGKALGIKLGTVKSRISRCLDKAFRLCRKWRKAEL
jgi:RNA polymerase sigma-70 factor (ECF subfamily)